MRASEVEERPLRGLAERIGPYTRRGALVCVECHRWVAGEDAEAYGWQYRVVGLRLAESEFERRVAVCPECADRRFRVGDA